jgi:hypothetical protein
LDGQFVNDTSFLCNSSWIAIVNLEDLDFEPRIEEDCRGGSHQAGDQGGPVLSNYLTIVSCNFSNLANLAIV